MVVDCYFCQLLNLSINKSSSNHAPSLSPMMEQISPKLQDNGIKNNEGKPIAGGQLFWKYLLNHCQKDFEHEWVVKEAAAATKATSMEDQAVKAQTIHPLPV